jgi:hypothetical protein
VVCDFSFVVFLEFKGGIITPKAGGLHYNAQVYFKKKKKGYV